MTSEERIKELESDIREMNQTIEYYQTATLKAEAQLVTTQAEAAKMSLIFHNDAAWLEELAKSRDGWKSRYYELEEEIIIVRAEAAMTACALSELEAHLVLSSAVPPPYSAPWLKIIREALARSAAPTWLELHDCKVQEKIWNRFEARGIGDQDILGGAFVKSIVLKPFE